ncbi:MAG: N-formylglutamate amidohydrolase, partial [Deltaproteobacteria bacterium]|nr:N-formylglutamate amidohydrolase [Deltaproteobacteria bacterium]
MEKNIPPWELTMGESPLVAFAIHSGHTLRSEIAASIGIDEDTRHREEDPYTDQWTVAAPTTVIVNQSRFEVDLNRPRDKAVYIKPEDAWGLDVWQQEPDEALVEHSRQTWDLFYQDMKNILSAIERTHGRFVVLDFHSYNHMRDGSKGKPADEKENPVIN